MKKILLLSLLIINPSFAEMMCDDATDYFAIYEIDSYTCSPGEYLPANTVGCVSCPNGWTCNGGTFDFNTDEYQGLELGTITTTPINNICAANFPVDLYSVYEPNQHTCEPGYYLPANVDSCTICPQNNYCVGGTYYFNKTNNQGIISCPSEHPFAPVGMWQSNQCGRKLHIGNDVIYMHQIPANPTEHRLFIQVGNDIYSANAVPAENNPKQMSAGVGRSLHITINGADYVVHDDSVE